MKKMSFEKFKNKSLSTETLQTLSGGVQPFFVSWNCKVTVNGIDVGITTEEGGAAYCANLVSTTNAFCDVSC